MKKLALVTLLAMGLASVGQVANAADRVPERDMRSVDHMRIFDNIDGWRPLDQQSLIIWATPFRPYLVKLSRPSHDLRFEQKIGVTSLAGTVHAKFDSVVVNGIRYPISAIYALDRYAARHMQDTV